MEKNCFLFIIYLWNDKNFKWRHLGGISHLFIHSLIVCRRDAINLWQFRQEYTVHLPSLYRFKQNNRWWQLFRWLRVNARSSFCLRSPRFFSAVCVFHFDVILFFVTPHIACDLPCYDANVRSVYLRLKCYRACFFSFAATLVHKSHANDRLWI